MAKDMRSYLEQLERAGELTRLSDLVDVDVDIGRRLFGLAFGTEPNKVVTEFARRIDKGLVKCSMFDSGPVKQRILSGSDARPLTLPAHVIGEKDPGRYIAGGLC